MRETFVLGLVALVLATGCAGAGYSSGDARKDACEKSGGYWQSSSSICERPRS